MSGWGSYDYDVREGQAITDILKEKGLAFVLRRCRDYASLKSSEFIGQAGLYSFWSDKQTMLDDLIGSPQSRW